MNGKSHLLPDVYHLLLVVITLALPRKDSLSSKYQCWGDAPAGHEFPGAPPSRCPIKNDLPARGILASYRSSASLGTCWQNISNRTSGRGGAGESVTKTAANFGPYGPSRSDGSITDLCGQTAPISHPNKDARAPVHY